MNKIWLAPFAAFLFSYEVTVPKAALYRYNKDATKTHYFTTNKKELGEGKDGYVWEGVACYIHTKKVKHTVAFYRYANANDFVYTISFDKDIIESKESYKLQKKVGYIYTNNVKGTVPLFKYYSPSLKRHFYTVSYDEIGKRDYYYLLEGIAGYVFSPGK